MKVHREHTHTHCENIECVRFSSSLPFVASRQTDNKFRIGFGFSSTTNRSVCIRFVLSSIDRILRLSLRHRFSVFLSILLFHLASSVSLSTSALLLLLHFFSFLYFSLVVLSFEFRFRAHCPFCSLMSFKFFYVFNDACLWFYVSFLSLSIFFRNFWIFVPSI